MAARVALAFPWWVVRVVPLPLLPALVSKTFTFVYPQLKKMKTVACLAALLASASAFAPAQQGASSTQLQASELDQEIGAVAPLGFFDPLGYITDEETFVRYRAVERKHGRIAMMAMLGTFVHEVVTGQSFAEQAASGHFSPFGDGQGFF